MNIFQKLPVPKVHFSNFNMTHEYKCGMEMGDLVPIQCLECVPNDTWFLSNQVLVRFAPMKFPVMHRINMKLYHFFVPNRLIWKYWQEFISEAVDTDLPAKPYFVVNDLLKNEETKKYYDVGSLADYLGLPVVNRYVQTTGNEPISVEPFLAYQKIWNDYFRDENLQPDLFEDTSQNVSELVDYVVNGQGHLVSGDLLSIYDDLFTLRKKAWEKDYFTSALPDPQLGEPVPVPVQGVVELNPNLTVTVGSQEGLGIFKVGGVQSPPNGGLTVENGKLSSEGAGVPGLEYIRGSLKTPNPQNLGVVKNASFSINDLRLASSIQRFRELLARAGHRYKETILSMFNQVTPDYRLDRPEFIGSTNIPVVISDIPQTSQTESQSAQGNLAGRGTVQGGTQSFKYHCQEHGFIMTLACVIPRTSYQNGLSRMWTRMDRYDYFTPVFENLGEQEIKKKELYFGGNFESDNSTFGYAPRYSDYKYIPSSVHGDFLTSLDFMHLGRIFEDYPALNGDFITPDGETMRRPFSVTSDIVQHLYCEFLNNTRARRPMQKNPIPKLI